MKHLFVYGTLKRGCSNHAQMAGQRFVTEARTIPGYRLFDVGGFPGLIAWPHDRDGVTGEIWAVDDAALARLDRFEGVDEGLYRRERIALVAPHDQEPVDGYVYARSVDGLREVGATWRE
ncbi:MAG TPA: gamma-glutamylcyclotransferase family protein [Opitutaceae bacterium]